jgi:hypothetical protein
MFKFIRSRGLTAITRGKRASQASEKRHGPERPVRYYSLLLPPTLPHDRK